MKLIIIIMVISRCNKVTHTIMLWTSRFLDVAIRKSSLCFPLAHLKATLQEEKCCYDQMFVV